MTEQENHSSPKEEEKEEEGFDSAPVQPKQVLITDEELRNIQRELMEYKDKYLHLLADVDNARKRMQKEKHELARFALEGFVVDFLRPLDNFENALRFSQEMSDEVRNWAFGFQMILTQFKDVLAQHHIVAIESVGKKFNPHDHEAIEMVESTEPPETIVEECMRGYRMGDRLIRPARVKVAKKEEKHSNHTNEEF